MLTSFAGNRANPFGSRGREEPKEWTLSTANLRKRQGDEDCPFGGGDVRGGPARAATAPNAVFTLEYERKREEMIQDANRAADRFLRSAF